MNQFNKELAGIYKHFYNFLFETQSKVVLPPVKSSSNKFLIGVSSKRFVSKTANSWDLVG